jgi:DNA gyrase subunit A
LRTNGGRPLKQSDTWKGFSLSTGSEGPDEGEELAPAPQNGNGDIHGGRLIDLSIEDELKGSYLTYAMSVIVSRALPDVRDGLKPSQRRILVAMNDLNLTPGASRVKCAKISGDTSGNYHPHGESVIYPTLVRMAQEWNMRHVLIDKQGNFGSIAGLPAAAMRYTEARMSPIASMMLEDLKLDTVDFVPTYDERRTEPTVLPSKFPNLLVNGANGIAVGMATSIPPHNLAEVCDGMVRVIDQPDVSIDELLEIIPGPDYPTGGIVLGRGGLRRGYFTGRGTITVRARADIEEYKKDRYRIVIHEIPFQQARDRVEERIAELVNDGKIKGISASRNESDLKEPVRLILEIKRDADPEVVLNQLYQFSPLQESFSVILLALVDGKPRTLTIKDMLSEFLRHRVSVIRRRTQFLLSKARRRKHTVEGLLLAHANIDEIIRIIRSSATQAEAKTRLMGVESPASMLQRALGDEGFAVFQSERGVADVYTLTPVQADAILRMTLGQLVNLEQERLGEEYRELLDEIREYLRILSDDKNILAIIREDMLEIKKKHGEPRRTEISGEEIGSIDLEDLITEETMVVTITHNGYIKRTPAATYRAQRRGGKGLIGARTDEEDPIQHLFVASTHDYLLFFTNKGKVYWQKVYDLPLLGRESRGRAVVNLLNFGEDEKIADCRAIRNFDEPGAYLIMATRSGLVKKTALEAYSRPKRGGIIAINLRENDELVDVAVVRQGDEVVLSTARGQAIRFRESQARAMGRDSSGVRGIKLRAGDSVVGMVVTDPEATLLTVCANGYGKRTPFGPNLPPDASGEEDDVEAEGSVIEPEGEAEPEPAPAEGGEEAEERGSHRYPTKKRGGLGVRDIKTTDRNGPVISIVTVREEDELIMMTARGKIQRIAAREIGVKGRNTQGVRIMSLDDDDTLAAVVRVPSEESSEGEAEAKPAPTE